MVHLQNSNSAAPPQAAPRRGVPKRGFRRHSLRCTYAIKNFFSSADEALTKLLKAGSEEDRLYRQFKEHIDEAACEECESYYKEGFRFGVLLGLDIAEEQ